MKKFLAVLVVLAFVAVPVFAQTTYRATLSWTDNSDNEQGFRIERGQQGFGDWIAVGEVASNVVSFVDEPLTSGESLCWRIVAFNSAGDSLPSPQACATVPTPQTPPAAPGGLQIIISIAGDS